MTKHLKGTIEWEEFLETMVIIQKSSYCKNSTLKKELILKLFNTGQRILQKVYSKANSRVF